MKSEWKLKIRDEIFTLTNSMYRKFLKQLHATLFTFYEILALFLLRNGETGVSLISARLAISRYKMPLAKVQGPRSTEPVNRALFHLCGISFISRHARVTSIVDSVHAIPVSRVRFPFSVISRRQGKLYGLVNFAGSRRGGEIMKIHSAFVQLFPLSSFSSPFSSPSRVV